LALLGCGGLSAKQKAAARQVEAQRLATATKSQERKVAAAEAAVEYASCNGQVGRLISRLEDLSSRLDVGLNFSDYSSKVGDVSVAYHRIDFKGMDFQCLAAGVPAEAALNAYDAAYNKWNACISNFSCSTHSIKPFLQEKWAVAAVKTESARGLLKRVAKPDYSAVGAWSLSVPTASSAISGTVYGAAKQSFCTNPKTKFVNACSELSTVLTGGVSSHELDQLDRAVKDLNTALGIEPTKS